MNGREEVRVVGTGCARFGLRPEASFADLLCEAAFEALWDAGVGPESIDGAWLSGGERAERRRGPAALTEAVGLRDIPVWRTGAGGVPDGAALRAAALALRSGEHDLVLVAGGEKQSHRSAVANAAEVAIRSGHPVFGYGLTPAGLAGLFARRMFASRLLARAHLDAVVVKNRLQGELDEHAWLRFAVGDDDLAGAPFIADPLTVLDVAPPVDGAAAVVLARGTKRAGKSRPVRVTGISYQVTGGEVLPLFDARTDFLTRPAGRSACFVAYAQAGIVNPWSQLNLAEVDDSTSVGELLAYEDLSFCGRGECGVVMGQGVTTMDGQLPVNASGGSLSSGSAPGADVLRRVFAVTRQLQGRAGDQQVDGSRVGVVHGEAGGGTEGFVAVLSTEGS